jgi:hypothetical protein
VLFSIDEAFIGVSRMFQVRGPGRGNFDHSPKGEPANTSALTFIGFGLFLAVIVASGPFISPAVDSCFRCKPAAAPLERAVN